MNHPMASPSPRGSLSGLRTSRTRSKFLVVLCVAFLVGNFAQPIASGAEPENTSVSIVATTQSLHDVTQVVANNGNIFIANNPSDGAPELWRSDGTVSGTTQLIPTAPFPIYSNSVAGAIPTYSDSGSSPTRITKMISWRSGVAFILGAVDPRDPNQLWVSDGTRGGTKQLPLRTDLGNFSILQTFENKLYFKSELSTDIFATDGTTLIPGSEIYVAIQTNISENGGGFYVGFDGIYFTDSEDKLAYSAGMESPSLQMLVNPNYPNQSFSCVVSLGGSILYSGAYSNGVDSSDALFLWNRSTNSNTFLTSFSADSQPRSVGTSSTRSMSYFIASNGIAYFASGNSLWQSNGSVSGTHVLPSTGVNYLLGTFLGNWLVYVANENSGKTLRKYNVVSGVDSLIGTPAFETSPDNFVVSKDVLYFTAQDSEGYSQLYSYAISPSDTQLIIQSQTQSSSATYSSRQIEEQIEAVKLQAKMEITNSLKSSINLTVESFIKADIRGITAKNIAEVQAEILELSEVERLDISQVVKIAHKYEVVGIIGSDAIKTLPANSLVDIGLIPEASKNKMSLLAAVKKLPETARDSYAEIKRAIDAETAVIEERKNRLEAAKSRNSNRYKK